MKVEKPDWLKLKEAHDAEIVGVSLHGREIDHERPRSRGVMYGPTESKVDQLQDGYVDLNVLMKRFDHMPTAEELQAAGLAAGGIYVDEIGAPDFEQAVKIKNAAQAAFDLMHAGMRERFGNNPANFLAFVGDPANHEECVRLGIKKPAEPKKEPETTLKDVVDTLKAGQQTKTKRPARGEDEEA